MKNTIKLLGGALVAAMVLFTACGGAGDSPKAVAQKFITALEDKKFDEASSVATEETKQAVKMIESFASMMRADAKKKEFEFGEEKIDGDKASVSYKEKGSDKDQTVNLVKKDGKWLVAMSKEDLTGGPKTEEPAVEAPVEGDSTSAPVEAAPATEAK